MGSLFAAMRFQVRSFGLGFQYPNLLNSHRLVLQMRRWVLLSTEQRLWMSFTLSPPWVVNHGSHRSSKDVLCGICAVCLGHGCLVALGRRCTSHLPGVRGEGLQGIGSRIPFFVFDTAFSERILGQRRWVMTVVC